MSVFKIAVLPGDGIGQEVTAEAVRVLRAIAKQSGTSFEFEQALIGGSAIDAGGHPLPAETLKLCQGAHAILFGAVGGPKWDGLPQESKPERGLLGLRKELDLYANLRPATCFPMLVDASPLKRSVVAGCTSASRVASSTSPTARPGPSTRWRTPRARSSAWPAWASRWRASAASG